MPRPRRREGADDPVKLLRRRTKLPAVPTMEQLSRMTLDEKIESAISDLEELNAMEETREVRQRKEDLRLALYGYSIVKDARDR